MERGELTLSQVHAAAHLKILIKTAMWNWCIILYCCEDTSLASQTQPTPAWITFSIAQEILKAIYTRSGWVWLPRLLEKKAVVFSTHCMWLCRPRTTFSPWSSASNHTCVSPITSDGCLHKTWEQSKPYSGGGQPSLVPRSLPNLIERSLGTRLGQSGLRKQLLSVSVVLSRVWEGMPRGGSLKGTDDSMGVLSEGTVPEDAGNTWAHPRDDCSCQDPKNSRYGQRCHRGSETL